MENVHSSSAKSEQNEEKDGESFLYTNICTNFPNKGVQYI